MITILMVDDDQTLRTLYKTYFENSHYQLELAVNGEHALDLLKSITPDLIITDIDMPIMNGLNFFSEVKKRTSISSIGMSSNKDYAPEVLKNGARKFLLKPIKHKKLIDVIDNAIKEEIFPDTLLVDVV